MTREVVVVGCGVSGLSTAIRLLERGFAVTIAAPARPSDADYATRHGSSPPPCSPWAAAVWYPYHVAEDARVLVWLRDTLAELLRLEAEEPGCGVATIELIECLGEGVDPPESVAALPSFAWLEGDEVPPGWPRAYRVPVALVDTPVYLPWLERRFDALGGRFERRVLASLDEVRAPGRVVVNCTGLGARELARDPRMRPSRGQVLRVARPAGFALRSIVGVASDHTPTYVFPRGADVVLGGTDELDVWDEGTDPPTLDSIRARCEALEPEVARLLAGGAAVTAGSGLRPVRDGGVVRLEAEEAGGGCTLIHNYGHGGSGYTLSWGCADEVARLAETAVG
ncbi:MAG TPA: FAD-dependent oxidoreductase [Longimicrobium sp.]|nr:FAD-dependent oxidoreductase [Longimicrobium sp.]